MLSASVEAMSIAPGSSYGALDGSGAILRRRAHCTVRNDQIHVALRGILASWAGRTFSSSARRAVWLARLILVLALEAALARGLSRLVLVFAAASSGIGPGAGWALQQPALGAESASAAVGATVRTSNILECAAVTLLARTGGAAAATGVELSLVAVVVARGA